MPFSFSLYPRCGGAEHLARIDWYVCITNSLIKMKTSASLGLESWTEAWSTARSNQAHGGIEKTCQRCPWALFPKPPSVPFFHQLIGDVAQCFGDFRFESLIGDYRSNMHLISIANIDQRGPHIVHLLLYPRWLIALSKDSNFDTASLRSVFSLRFSSWIFCILKVMSLLSTHIWSVISSLRSLVSRSGLDRIFRLLITSTNLLYAPLSFGCGHFWHRMAETTPNEEAIGTAS